MQLPVGYTIYVQLQGALKKISNCGGGLNFWKRNVGVWEFDSEVY